VFSQADIDAVLNNAQEAVDSLAREADVVTGGFGTHHGAARSPAPAANAVAAPPPPHAPARPLDPPPNRPEISIGS